MEGFTLGEIAKSKRMELRDLDQFGREEIERVTKALEEAEKKLADLRQSKIITAERAMKVSELNLAIAAGRMYLKKLINKWR